MALKVHPQLSINLVTVVTPQTMAPQVCLNIPITEHSVPAAASGMFFKGIPT